MSSFKAALAGVLLLGLSGPGNAALDEAALDEVARALAAGDHGSAIARLQAMPAGERDSYRARLLYAGALSAQGKREEAAALYRALIAEAPGQPEPYNNLAVLYASQGRTDEALQLLEQAMKTSASYATVRANLGQLYLEMSLNSYAKALRVEERETAPSLQALYQLNDTGSAPVDALVLAQAGPAMSAGTDPAPPAGEGVELEMPPTEALSLPDPGAEPYPDPGSQPAPLLESVAAEGEAEPAALAMADPSEADESGGGVPGAAEMRSEEAPVTMPVAAAEPASGDGSGKAPGPEAAVLNAVQQWAKAWQGQDVEAYLAAYAAGFVPSQGLSRGQWQAQRRQRLSKPALIEVGLEEIAVELTDATHARVKFLQHYRSDRYRDKTRKRLLLVNDGEGWKILAEKTLEVVR